MTSGLANYTETLFPDGDVQKAKAIRFRTFKPRELVKLATAHGPDFAPGARYEYSNTNYVLLGLVIEAITGHPAEQEIDRRIIQPLHLKNTFFPARSESNIAGPHPNGYFATKTKGKPDLDYTVENVSWAYTAGALVSTTTDLAAFWRGLLGGKLLPADQLQRMLTDKAVGQGYGLGVEIYDTPCGAFYGHNGDIPGYSTKPYTSRDGSKQLVVEVSLLPTNDAQDRSLNAFAALLCPPAADSTGPSASAAAG